MGRLSEHQLHAVVERLPQGVIAVDPALKVVFSNEAAALFTHPEPLRVGHELTRDRCSAPPSRHATKCAVRRTTRTS
jgi:PAS domain-containing protein